MPLYEYRCEACGRLQEHLVRNDQTPACSECGSPRLSKLVSAPVAHVGAKSSPSEWQGCGKPQCGSGGCAGMM